MSNKFEDRKDITVKIVPAAELNRMAQKALDLQDASNFSGVPQYLIQAYQAIVSRSDHNPEPASRHSTITRNRTRTLRRLSGKSTWVSPKSTSTP
jgi:hypothetical protein